MDLSYALGAFSEMVYFAVVFGAFFIMSMVWGYRVLISVNLGIYLAILLYFQFPFSEQLLSGFSNSYLSVSLFQLSLFAVIVLMTSSLCSKLFPDRQREGYLKQFPRKVFLAFAATILVMAFSFQVFPAGDLSSDTPLQSLFTPENSTFWWLLLPLVILYMV